jgi:hypothetical protein
MRRDTERSRSIGAPVTGASRAVTVGVDVDDGALTVARLRPARGPHRTVDRARLDVDVVSLPRGAVVDGIVRDADAVVDALRHAGGVRSGARLRVGLTTPRLWTAVLDVDPPARWTTTLPRQVVDRVPVAAEDAHVTVNLLAPSDLDAPGRRRALVVAMRREDLTGVAACLARIPTRQPMVTLAALAVARWSGAGVRDPVITVAIDRRPTVTSLVVARSGALVAVLHHTTADLPVPSLVGGVRRSLATCTTPRGVGSAESGTAVDLVVLAPVDERAVLLPALARALQDDGRTCRERTPVAPVSPDGPPSGRHAAMALAQVELA